MIVNWGILKMEIKILFVENVIKVFVQLVRSLIINVYCLVLKGVFGVILSKIVWILLVNLGICIKIKTRNVFSVIRNVSFVWIM